MELILERIYRIKVFSLFICNFRKMAEQMHSVSDLSKLNDLKFKKRPILAEFYTEYAYCNIQMVPSLQANSKSPIERDEK